MNELNDNTNKKLILNQYNDFSIKEICEKFNSIFKNRIICLLYYGSHAYDREIKETSDYDFCLVLDERQSKDNLYIRKVLNGLKKVELTLHYLKDLEEDGWDNFHSDNHGIFYMYHFASTQAIIGNNIFARKIHLLQSADVIASLRRQVIEYFWRLDNIIFTLPDNELINSDILRKYSIRILQDLLIIKGEISFEEINRLNYTEFYNDILIKSYYISNTTKELVWLIINKLDISVENIIVLKEVLYEDFKNCIR